MSALETIPYVIKEWNRKSETQHLRSAHKTQVSLGRSHTKYILRPPLMFRDEV